MGKSRIRIARENHQFSAHRSPRFSDTSRTWFGSTAGVGGRTFEPAYLVRCALLRKPTKGLNCNGIQGGLSTECRLTQLIERISRAARNRLKQQRHSTMCQRQTASEPGEQPIHQG